MSSRAFLRLLSLLVSVLLIAAACGGEDDDVATTPEDEVEQATPTPDTRPPLPDCTIELVDTDATESDIDNTTLANKPIIEKPIPADPGVAQAYDIVVGDGEVAEAGSTIVMQYAGATWETGDEFDSTWARGGAPFPFDLGQGQVIAGWDLGIEGMQVGGRRQLVLPANCAYGRSGSGSGNIGPDATLIFIVDLEAVEPTIELPDSVSGEVEWEDLEVGDGVELAAGDQGVIEWVGVFFETGVKVGSSASLGEPLTFTVGQNSLGVEGFDEAITGMKVGGIRQMVLPPPPVEEGLEGVAGPETLVLRAELVNVIPVANIEDKPEVEVPDEDTDVLVVEDLIEGEGDEVAIGDTVYVQYVGVEYPTGVQFDASWDRGEAFPVTIGSGQVIEGWEEGLVGMKLGGRRQLVIPPAQAYGVLEEGEDPVDGDLRGKTLVFVVDLVALG